MFHVLIDNQRECAFVYLCICFFFFFFSCDFYIWSYSYSRCVWKINRTIKWKCARLKSSKFYCLSIPHSHQYYEYAVFVIRSWNSLNYIHTDNWQTVRGYYALQIQQTSSSWLNSIALTIIVRSNVSNFELTNSNRNLLIRHKTWSVVW